MPNVDEPGALALFVPNSLIFPNYEGHKPTYVVIHKTGGPGDAQQQAQFFAGPANTGRVSTHYVVGQDGVVVQCVAESNAASGNCCCEPGHASFLPDTWGTTDNGNLHTISVEHCDPSLDNSTPVTAAQQSASFQLIHHICQRHGIPMRPGDANGGIIGHYQIAAKSRQHCPGNYPWVALWAYLAQRATQAVPPARVVPAGWHDDGIGTLTGPNGVTVVRGFRVYVLTHAWDKENWPLAVETARDPVEDSNPALGSGTWQPFRWSVLEWTAARGVFPAWVGQELVKARQELAKLPAPTPPVAG